MTKRINSLEDLDKIKNRVKPLLAVREELTQGNLKKAKQIDVLVCRGTGCTAAGAADVEAAFLDIIKGKGMQNRVIPVKTGCRGFCEKGPNVIITPGQTLYTEVKASDVEEIVEKHLLNNQIVERLLYCDPVTGNSVSSNHDVDFYKNQTRVVMHLNGLIDPWNIEEYMAFDGYQALVKALTQMTPEQVLDEVTKSGLRGRGGAGFPTGRKWSFVRSAPGDEKFVLCNGDEGDPGAFMNRSVLEGNPNSVVEGMVLGAYAIGKVHQGHVYVRAEYPLAIETLSHAIKQAEEYGLLGKNILNTGFDFSLDIFPGAGAFVCGEETALMVSIEGKRGNPKQRPPFPAIKGLFGKPTTLNNVETWSNIPRIVLNGGEWYSKYGVTTNTGTKTFCLVGKISRSGIAEVPLGTPLGKLVFDIGGGPPGGKRFKAVQIGGPSGGVIPVELLNTPVDYESVTAQGAIMGSGGLIVLDEDSCMVDVAKYFLQFTTDESCGKCTPCRAGIPKMLQILNKITRGQATMEDVDVLRELAEMVGSASLCGLGQTAPNPVLSTLRHFRSEYEAHIIDKHCPAAVCQPLFKAPCQHTCPVELDCPGYVALIKQGKYAEAYKLIRQRLPFPMSVGRVCDHPCESKCRRAQVDKSVSIRNLKRMAADYAYEHGVDFVPPMKPRKPESVAIVGAGPAGLTAAYELIREGYHVTVFEALPVAGGMMAVAIPEYRLPKKILQAEIDNILKLGVELKLNTRIDDIDNLLKEGYKAVFISCGAHRGDKMGIPGEAVEGVYDAIEFLREMNLGKKPKVGKRVAVVGGGNSAMDAARVALRQGAEEVHILYRRERKDMPAIEEEIDAVEEEGVHVDCLTAPTKVLSQNGKLTGLECVRMELKGFDSSGRRSPNPVSGSEYTIAVDTLIEAIGQRPDTSMIKDGQVKLAKGGTIVADPRTLATSRPGVFAGGDAVTGPKTVIWAVSAGQRAATSINRYLQGKPLSPFVERDGYEPIEVPAIMPTEEELKARERAKPAHMHPDDSRLSYKEVELALRPGEAREEASRCMRCDIEA